MAQPAFQATPRPQELAQGDLMEAVEFLCPQGNTYRDNNWAKGIVVSHSCDFTKFKADEEKGRKHLDRFPLLVAPVIPFSSIGDSNTANHARKGRVMRYFHLSADGPLAEEEDHFVDFWFIQPASVFELLDIGRLASMSDEWQIRLQIALDRFFSRTAVAS
jgi:hypothetical protein